jgi:hypothetical protein
VGRSLRVSVVLIISLAAVPAAAQVQLVIENGLVSLSATGVPLSDVLAEWERVGRTRIFNREQVSGEVTLRLEKVPEERALEILLRSLNGYVAAPRTVVQANASRFDRIMVMPGVARPRTSAGAPPSPAAAAPDPPFQLPGAAGPEDEDAPAAERPVRIVPAPGQRVPMLTPTLQAPARQTPAPAEETPPAYGTPPAQPGMPAGVPVPGMIVPAPRQDEDQETPNRPSPGR